MNLMNKRIEAFAIDAIVLFAMSSPFMLISIVLFNNLVWMNFVLAVIYALLLCKDVDGGKSFGKRNAGLCILLKKDDSRPSTTRLILRNLFYILWPIEVALLFCNSGKRLGDMITQTMVVSCDKESKIRFRFTRKYIGSVMIMTIVLFALFLSISKLMYKLYPWVRLFYS